MTSKADLTYCYDCQFKNNVVSSKIIITCQKIFGHFFSIRSVITLIVVLVVLSDCCQSSEVGISFLAHLVVCSSCTLHEKDLRNTSWKP